MYRGHFPCRLCQDGRYREPNKRPILFSLSFIMSEIAPPAYNAPPPGDHRIDDDSKLPPPNYTVPTSFKIGQSRTSEPLVKISEIKGHLTLLHVFAELKKQVDGDEATVQVAPNVSLDRERRWTWFVGVAVERYVPNNYSLHCLSYSNVLSFPASIFGHRA